jgi:hypothetical protein
MYQRETINLVDALAANLAPAALAAVIRDLGEYTGESERDERLLHLVDRKFREQLVCMVGEIESHQMIEVDDELGEIPPGTDSLP